MTLGFLIVVIIVISVVAVALRGIKDKNSPRESPDKRRYVALQICSAILRISGYLLILAGILIIVIPALASIIALPTLPSASSDFFPFAGVIFGAVPIILGIWTVAGGELIRLLIDVEGNTRNAEFYSEQTKHSIDTLIQAVTKPRSPPPPQVSRAPSGIPPSSPPPPVSPLPLS